MWSRSRHKTRWDLKTTTRGREGLFVALSPFLTTSDQLGEGCEAHILESTCKNELVESLSARQLTHHAIHHGRKDAVFSVNC